MGIHNNHNHTTTTITLHNYNNFDFTAMPTTHSSPPPYSHLRSMPITDTYLLVRSARSKLSSEAARPDHNLRFLVGHANLLDTLMLDLAHAERAQEAWYAARPAPSAPSAGPRRVQWADAVTTSAEDWEQEEEDEDSESDSDYSDLEEFDDDGEEDLERLQLHTTRSHPSPPPPLEHDADSSDEDDDTPPSPPADVRPTFSAKQRQQIATTGFFASSSEVPEKEEEEREFYPQTVRAVRVY